ncbi:hypothetical protein PODOV061v2_0015 [Vibrio phage 172P1]|nr:hypothetical protein PODOV061v2_0015 [Vibrio phage 172P1]
MSSKDTIEIESFQGLRARTVQSYNEANVKSGVQFYLGVNWPTADQIANGPVNARNIVFVTGDTPVIIKTRIVSFEGEEFTIELFEGSTYTGGSAITVGNYNQVNPVATTVTALKDVTITDEGTGFAGEPDYYLGGTTGNRDAQAIPDGRERILKTNTTYLVRVTSVVGTGRFSYFIDWYEGGTDLPRPQNDN